MAKCRLTRLAWSDCIDNVTWNIQQWSSVLFTEMMAVNAAGGVEVSEMPLSMWFPDTDMEGVV